MLPKIRLFFGNQFEKEARKVMIQHNKALAEQYLGQLRSGSGQYDWLIRNLRKEMEEGSLSLKDVGTNNEELRKFQVAECKRLATMFLTRLRQGINDHGEHDSYRRFLKEELGKGDLSLANVGTSSKELRECRINSCKLVAQGWLAALRKKGSGPHKHSFLLRIREALEMGNLSLASIGTSRKELSAFE